MREIERERETTAYLENCKLATTFAGSKHVNYVTVAVYIYLIYMILILILILANK